MDNKHRQSDTQKNMAWWMPAIIISARFSAWIVIPVLIAAWAGSWLDRKFQMSPLIFLCSVGFAFLVSMFGIVKGTLNEYRKIEAEGKKKNSHKK